MNKVEKVVRLKVFTLLIFSIVFLGVEAPYCRADDVYTFVVKKQEEKEKRGWYLTDWLAARDKMRMQDLWLALHSPSPYEFYLSGNYQFNQGVGVGNLSAWEASFAAFATIFGLEFRYESGNSRRLHGIFNLRVFGYHDQGTNLTLQVGVRQQEGADTFRNVLAGAYLTLYFAKFFGIEGIYKHYFSSTPNVTGVSVVGDRLQGGVFIDFKFLRIYGNYLVEKDILSSVTGIIAGTKLFF